MGKKIIGASKVLTSWFLCQCSSKTIHQNNAHFILKLISTFCVFLKSKVNPIPADASQAGVHGNTTCRSELKGGGGGEKRRNPRRCQVVQAYPVQSNEGRKKCGCHGGLNPPSCLALRQHFPEPLMIASSSSPTSLSSKSSSSVNLQKLFPSYSWPLRVVPSSTPTTQEIVPLGLGEKSIEFIHSNLLLQVI